LNIIIPRASRLPLAVAQLWIVRRSATLYENTIHSFELARRFHDFICDTHRAIRQREAAEFILARWI
jgi:hypothetical protein